MAAHSIAQRYISNSSHGKKDRGEATSTHQASLSITKSALIANRLTSLPVREGGGVGARRKKINIHSPDILTFAYYDICFTLIALFTVREVPTLC